MSLAMQPPPFAIAALPIAVIAVVRPVERSPSLQLQEQCLFLLTIQPPERCFQAWHSSTKNILQVYVEQRLPERQQSE